jgi:hypothetical protein
MFICNISIVLLGHIRNGNILETSLYEARDDINFSTIIFDSNYLFTRFI